MDYNYLGNTDINVSKLCFGSLTLGPLQRNLDIEVGSNLIKEAINRGINFIDTADLYDTYPYIKEAIKIKKDMVISSKSYAYDETTAKATLQRSLEGIGRDYIDIFLLHEQENRYTLDGHIEALDFFIKQKKAGIIRAVGISTHYIAAVKSAALMEEIDIIHPILNYKGLGIVDGSLEDMSNAIELAYNMGKGIYTMKPLGGGHLINHYEEAISYIVNYPFLHSVAIGIQNIDELKVNISFFENKNINQQLINSLKKIKRELLINDWCCGCGECVRKCPQNALSLGKNNIAVVDKNKCVICGYCGAVCKELAIKVI